MFSPQFKTGLGLFAMRIGVAAILLSHGALKIATGATTWSADLPAYLQGVVAGSEIVAGLFLLLGLLTRLASVVVIVMQVGAIFLVTGGNGLIDVYGPVPPTGVSLTVRVGWEYNLALIAMSVGLLFLGGGAIALDQYVWPRLRRVLKARAPQAAPPVLTPVG